MSDSIQISHPCFTNFTVITHSHKKKVSFYDTVELEAALLTINNNTDTSYNSSNTDTVVASLHRVLVSASFQTTSLY